jgi:hypothetical protein
MLFKLYFMFPVFQVMKKDSILETTACRRIINAKLTVAHLREIARLLRNSKDYYRSDKCPLLEPVLRVVQ